VREWCLSKKRKCKWLAREKTLWYVWWSNTRYTLTGRRGDGMCVVRREVRDATNLARTLRSRDWEDLVVKKRKAAAEANASIHLAALESSVFAELLPLVEHMVTRKYDDGDAREPGWITIKTQGAAWLVQVKDPDTCSSFTAVGDSLDKALSTAALLLAAEEAPWEPDTWLQAAAARKKKK